MTHAPLRIAIAAAAIASLRCDDPPARLASGDGGAAAGAAGTAPARPAEVDAAAATAAIVSACPPCEPAPEPAKDVASDDALTLVAATFSDLPGWTDDHHAEVIPAFLASCARLAELADDAPVGVDGKSGRARQWRRACAEAAAVSPGDDDAARRFFEHAMMPYQARGKRGATGKLTGYYVQALRGARTRHGAYQTPLYGRPDDLVAIDLEQFIPDADGRRLWGRLDRARGVLHPYPTRRELRTTVLPGQGLELIWVDDPIDAVFAQIEGSGKVVLDDGTVQWLEFAGKNGQPYAGVGRILRELGELQAGEGTMDGIRAWLHAHPERFDEIVDRNRSFVFFALSPTPGARGSQGVTLTARRSLAVDRRFVAASTPLWVDTVAPQSGRRGTVPWRHLLIAQDTGGGIKGAVRGDIYWGDDAEAADLAGRMGDEGRYWLLLPREVVVKTAAP